MLTRRSLMAVARAAALNLASSAFVATDFNWPFSKAFRTPTSYSSIFGICFTLFQIVPCGLTARDNRLEKEVFFLFDERNQVNVVVARNDKNALSWVFRLVRVGQDVQQSTGLDGNHDAFKRNAPLFFERLVLLGTPAK